MPNTGYILISLSQGGVLAPLMQGGTAKTPMYESLLIPNACTYGRSAHAAE